MSKDLIVTLPRRVFGLECLSHWLVLNGSAAGGFRCVGCRTYIADRVSPVELSDSGEIDDDATELAPLCRYCSVGAAARLKAGWLTLTTAEAVELWAIVRREQARDSENEAERAVAISLDEVQRALAATQQARVNHGVDQVGA